LIEAKAARRQQERYYQSLQSKLDLFDEPEEDDDAEDDPHRKCRVCSL
jgi:hypothetical protein